MIAFASLGSYLENMSDKMARGPYSPALGTCVELAHKHMEKGFATGTDPTGRRWAKHAPFTVRMHGPHPILILTGVMRASTIGKAPNHIERIEQFEAVTGTSDEKAYIHQYGTDTIPQREFVGVDETVVDAMAEAVADFIIEEFV